MPRASKQYTPEEILQMAQSYMEKNRLRCREYHARKRDDPEYRARKAEYCREYQRKKRAEQKAARATPEQPSA